MKAELKEILLGFEGKREEIIPILQKIQEKFGYLPTEAMVEVSKFTNIPGSNIYAVATFYAQFRFTPRGKKHVMVCRGTACHVNGAPRVLEEIEEILGIEEGGTTSDLEYSLETVACIGACSLAPCVMIDKDVEAKITKKKVSELFGSKE